TNGYRYVLGSVLNQVLLHQSIIGLEAKAAMDKLEEYPDIVIGCAGGGSNLGGLIAPYMQDKLLGKANPRIVAVEPATSAVLSGKKPGPHKIQGIGAGFVPKVLDLDIIDEIIPVENDDAFNASRAVAKA
ncbi:MAG: pyridoxal-phosphate dependent enzyme, partial [Clostridiales bacterium]|nr:pyridoxal-phosphate dependent enzyme [Clostridiales bacterium]